MICRIATHGVFCMFCICLHWALIGSMGRCNIMGKDRLQMAAAVLLHNAMSDARMGAWLGAWHKVPFTKCSIKMENFVKRQEPCLCAATVALIVQQSTAQQQLLPFCICMSRQ